MKIETGVAVRREARSLGRRVEGARRGDDEAGAGTEQLVGEFAGLGGRVTQCRNGTSDLEAQCDCGEVVLVGAEEGDNTSPGPGLREQGREGGACLAGGEVRVGRGEERDGDAGRQVAHGIHAEARARVGKREAGGSIGRRRAGWVAGTVRNEDGRVCVGAAGDRRGGGVAEQLGQRDVGHDEVAVRRKGGVCARHRGGDGWMVGRRRDGGGEACAVSRPGGAGRLPGAAGCPACVGACCARA